VVKCYLHNGNRFNAQFGISSHIGLKQGYLFYVMSIFGCCAQGVSGQIILKQEKLELVK
jgi:hypothetical protein